MFSILDCIMKYFLAHAGEDHAGAAVTPAETSSTDTLLPIIIITLACLVGLALVVILLSQRNKPATKSATEDETE